MVKVIAWMGNHTDDSGGASPILFAGGRVLRGMGPMQTEVDLPPATTLGAIREEWGDLDVGLGLPEDTAAWVYGDAGSIEFIVAEVQL